MADNLTDPLPDMVLCADNYGRLLPVGRHTLQPGMAAYGVLLERGQVLLQIDLQTGLLQPPGGMLDGYQEPAIALKQLFRAASGLTPTVGQLLLIDETFRYYEGAGLHLAQFYYLVHRPTSKVGSFIDFENSRRPQWVKIDQLERRQLLLGFNAIRIAASFTA